MSNKLHPILVLAAMFSPLLSQDQGLEHFNKQEFDQARAYYEAIIEKGQKSPAVEFGLGASAYQQNDYETAKQAFEKALSTADKQLKAKAYYNMGNTLYKAQRREESLAFFRKALELKPDDKDAKFNYELLKYSPPPPEQKQGGKGKSDEKDQQKENQDQKQEERKHQQQSKKGDQDQNRDQQKKSDESQQQKDQQSSAAEKQQKQEQNSALKKTPKSSDLRQAESILNALKQDEKILQKRQIAHAKSRELDKDW